jgi:hypothetical protein
MLPEKQIPAPQSSHQILGIGPGALEFSLLAEMLVLRRARAGKHLGVMLAVEPPNGVRAIHRPRLHLSRRNPWTGIRNPLGCEPMRMSLQIRPSSGTPKKDQREQNKTGVFHG